MGQSSISNNRLKAVALGLAVALSALTLRHWQETFSSGHPSCDNCRPDFQAIYSGARLMWENRALLYDVEAQLAIQKTIDPRVAESALAFAYPPTTALLLMPLGWLSFSGAYLAMTLVNILALLTTLQLLATRLDLDREQYRWLWLTTFCSFGVHSTVLQGQTSLVLLLPVSLFMISTRRGDRTTPGFWSGFLFLKPQLLPVPVLALAAQRRWRALGLALSLVAALAVVAVFLVGLDGVGDYVRIARRFGGSQSDLGTNPLAMHNLRALAYYALPAPLVMPAWIAAALLVAAGMLLLNGKNRTDEIGTASQWAGNLLAMILLSPHLHSHDLALLIPVNAVILKMWRDGIPAGVSLSLLALGIFPLLSWTMETSLPPVLPLVFLIGFLSCVWWVRSACAASVRNGGAD